MFSHVPTLYIFFQSIVDGVSGHPGVHAAEHVMLASGGGTAQAPILHQHLAAFLVLVTVLSWTHVASTLVVVSPQRIINKCLCLNCLITQYAFYLFVQINRFILMHLF